MTSHPEGDAELASSAREGDKEAFAALYRRYFDRIYDFLVRMTRDRELAGDLTQDTFLRAMERMATLDEPQRFRGWLYAIAHNQALNRLERERRSAPSDPGAEGPFLTQIDTTRLADPEEAAGARDVAELVWEAAQALDARTLAVLDLTLRHDLTSSEIAETMGVSRGNASVMVNRMKERMGDAIGTSLLVRQTDCEELSELVAGAEVLDEATRRRVHRHVARCERCQERRRHVASPTGIMAAYAATPPPEGLAETVWAEISPNWGRGEAGPALATRIGTIAAFLIVMGALGIAGAVRLGEGTVLLTTTTAPTSTSSATILTTTTIAATTTLGTTTTTLAPTTTEASTPTSPGSSTTTAPPPSDQPPVVMVTAPADGSHHTSSQRIRSVAVEATVTDDNDSGLVVRWTSSVDGSVGEGNITTVLLSASCPTPIQHVLTATAMDSSGGVGSDSVTITVGCPP
ncbi:MAG: sigma-70 family RNA polymerase sigma factor [Actinobacteria bacterium]|nr:sigma-70 family RNA polymerase sigma factor [Actinomycetota bacterium]